MADQLYLSLWFPNFRFDALPATLVSVMRQFATHQRRHPRRRRQRLSHQLHRSPHLPAHLRQRRPLPKTPPSSIIENAVAEATEQLHDDMAYEFEMRWKLWTPEASTSSPPTPPSTSIRSFETARLDTLWKLQPATVRILGFGPQFDDATFEQNGHIRIDFGLDTPWLAETLEDEELDEAATKHIQQNVEMLLAFTLSVEKNCGICSRLLWTESGEPLAQKLIDRLQRVN